MLSMMGSGPRVDPTLSSVILDLKENDYKFSDVVGMKGEIELLKNRLLKAHFETKSKIPLVKSVLLYGPAATGKSKLARVIVAEFCRAQRKSSYFSRRVNMFHVNTGKLIGNNIGETLQKISGIFQGVSILNPALLIIDDIDALIQSTDADASVVLNHLVSCIDNDLKSGSHLVILVTNICDPMSLPFKFQLVVPCYPLDSAGRKELLESYALKWGLDFTPDVLKQVVAKTRGCAQGKLIDFVDELVSRQFFSPHEEPPKWSEIVGALISILVEDTQPPLSCFRALTVPDCMAPLIETNVIDIVAEIRLRLMNALPFSDDERARKLLFVHHPTQPGKMKQVYETLLNDAILPCVLKHPTLVDIPSFIINEAILKDGTVSSLLTWIREANAYQKRCFLVMQNFPGMVAKVCVAKEDLSTLAGAINSCSPKVLIILTASMPYNKLPSPLRDVVHGLRDFEIQPVTEEEKIAFIRQVFDVEVVQGEDGQPRTKFARFDDHILFERAKEVAKTLGLEDLKDFQARLSDAKAWKNQDPNIQSKVIDAVEANGILDGTLDRSAATIEEDANSEVAENRIPEADVTITT